MVRLFVVNMIPVLLLIIFLRSIKIISTADVGRLPAMYVFGDSSVDVGNNNYLPLSKFKCNFPYYGVDFPGKVPTGRYSNGYNFVDFLAMKLGFDLSPPPSLSLQRKTSSNATGLNFASGGSGIMDVFDKSLCLSMKAQINQFRYAIKNLTRRGRKKKREIVLNLIQKSIFIVSTGNNDIFNYFYSNDHSSSNQTQEQEAFMSTLVTTFAHQIQKFYNLGARKMVVVGVGNIGCVPAARRRTTTGEYCCNHDLNHLVYNSFNKVMKEKVLPQLSSTTNGNLKYSFLDEYLASTAVMIKPHRYGFSEVKRACCGGGRWSAEVACKRPNATVCGDREHYVFWDSNHQTQAFSKLMANFAYGDGGFHQFTTPVNVGELVRY